MYEQIIKDLKKINPDLTLKSIDVYSRNIRIGFPEEISLLGLFTPFLDCGTKEEKQKIKELIKKYLKDSLEKIEDIDAIFDIECLKNENITYAYKKNPQKIYDLIFTKTTLIDVALAIMSYKITQINANDFYPDLNTFLQFIENCYCTMSQIFSLQNYTNLFDDFVITHKYPENYKKVLQITKDNLTRNKKEIEEIISELKKHQKHHNEIFKGRLKSAASVFKKIYIRNENPEDILDFVAIRIITTNIADCYSWLGIIYDLYNPRLSKFKDYIEHPKPNGYKSLHIVIDTNHGPVEFQIRTHNMNTFAEFGVAAHWKYKTKSNNKSLDKIKTDLNTLDPNFGQGYIFVFTPKRDIVLLDKESCAIDFAYAIHTDLGDHLEHAEINNIIQPLETKLKDNDLIKVYTDIKKGPARKWLDYCVTRKAKEKIAQTLKIIRTDNKNNKNNSVLQLSDKIQVAQCCNPFCDDEVGIYKNTKRKLILHKTACLDKNNLKYSYASDQLKNKFLLNKTIKIITNQKPSIIIEYLKTKFDLNDIELNDKNNTIVFNTNLQTKESFTKLKNNLQCEDFVDNVELI